MRVVSLDTPNEVLWARSNDREIDRIMRAQPVAQGERTTIRTSNGNLVQPVQR